MKHYSFRLFLIAIIIGICTLGCGGTKMLSEGSSLMTALSSNPKLSTFTSLLKTPGLDKLVKGSLKTPFTVLAPTNDAFSALGPDSVASLAKPENIGKLATLVKDQIVMGKQDPASLMKGGLTTAAGDPLNLTGTTLGSVMSADKVNIIPIDKILR